VPFCCGTPFSPWQAAQSCAFSSTDCARAAGGSAIAARMTATSQAKFFRSFPRKRESRIVDVMLE
jgi:hypothetical protein